MDILSDTNGVYTYNGRFIGPCTETDCACKAYCAPSPLGGKCGSCGHHPTSHSRLCDQCQSPIFDEKQAYHLCCLDVICSKCEKTYGPTDDIICPRCQCMTPRKPFIVDPDDLASSSESTLAEQFAAAAVRLTVLSKPAPDSALLELYGLYKQAKEGDTNTKRPGITDIKNRAKWDSWNSRKGLGSEDAMKMYVQIVDTLTAQDQ
ncbi:putative acyl-CoA-binding protein like protein [Blattamonas nauphoetae]|uniref:Acyl-CoA-binding protein like protein n=1 Tax=Blattamonas nauphoetae TaxID=2049346 RepID=A0ABQ9YK62_9EUKA|nr:putative acyl-CoA-binding protein like protein [Blattamonas nauphoetae]